jgi:porin
VEYKIRHFPRDVLGTICLTAVSLAIFAGMAFITTPASAQSQNPYQPTQPPTPPPSAPPPSQTAFPQASPPIGQPPSTPPPAAMGPVSQIVSFGNSIGKALSDKGIYLSGSYTENIAAMVAGGVPGKIGVGPSGEFSVGAVFDLQKMLGLTGGSFHVTFDERNGFSLNNNTGDSAGLTQGGVGPTRAMRLSELYYEQALYNDRIDIQVGRTNPTLNFATSDLGISCSTVGAPLCAQPASWYFSNASIAYPASTWGGFLNVQATPHAYFRTGVFDDDISQLDPNQQGFNFNVKGSAGVFLPLEIGYQTSLSDARYPAKYDIGGYWDDANYTLPNGVPARGRTAYYAQAEKTVWRPDPNSNQSVALFAGGIIYSGGAPYWSQFDAGIYDRAPFGNSRPDDTITLIGSRFANAQSERPNAPSMWFYEVNYNFTVVPGLTVKPFVDYIVAPNNLLDAFSSTEPRNAVTLGFQVSIDFGRFFGLPQFVAY